jgi:hypothetical protein
MTAVEVSIVRGSKKCGQTPTKKQVLSCRQCTMGRH